MSSDITEDEVKEQLKTVDYPGLNRDILSFGFVKDTTITNGSVEIDFDPSTDRDDVIDQMVDEIESKVSGLDGVDDVEVDVIEGDEEQQDQSPGSTTQPPGGNNPPQQQGQKKVAAAAPGATTAPDSGPVDHEPLPGVDHIIAVASGKGGVGKSTVAVNLAAALAENDNKVGLGDMDIYGPSAPTMLGVKERPKINADEKIIPPETRNIKTMSIGFVLDETEPVVWRGPMVMKAVTQFLRDVAWVDLDYLVLDLPPGTGDAQLTLMQKVPLSGAIIVTTPQDVALIDAQKSVEMFRKMDVEIIGIAENMSTFICPDCGTETKIFGSGGGRKEALRLNVPFLGGIPLEPDLREGGDEGEPIVFKKPQNESSQIFADMANEVEENSVPVEEVMEQLEAQDDQ